MAALLDSCTWSYPHFFPPTKTRYRCFNGCPRFHYAHRCSCGRPGNNLHHQKVHSSDENPFN